MKLFLIILVLSLPLQLFAPWWIIMVLAFAACLWLAKGAGQAFGSGFLAIFLVWLCASLLIHTRTGGLLTQRVSILLKLDSPVLLIFVSALAGALAAGLAGWAGFECKKLFRDKNLVNIRDK